MPQFDPYTSSSIASDHKNKFSEDATPTTAPPPPPTTLPKPAAQPAQPSECDMCTCCAAHPTPSHPQRPPTICTSPTSACCGTSCPDLDTDSDSNSPLHSPATFHQRHAHLRLQQQQEPLIASSGESFSGIRPSAEEQERETPELQRSQEEDDSIRMILASERRADAEGVNGDEPVPGEFSKEIRMLNGGWMERGKLC